jgi:hypothetical protein
MNVHQLQAVFHKPTRRVSASKDADRGAKRRSLLSWNRQFLTHMSLLHLLPVAIQSALSARSQTMVTKSAEKNTGMVSQDHFGYGCKENVKKTVLREVLKMAV